MASQDTLRWNAPDGTQMKRVVVTMAVRVDTDTHDHATTLAAFFGPNTDPTVWEWSDFWRDVADDQVSAEHDLTSRQNDSG